MGLIAAMKAGNSAGGGHINLAPGCTYTLAGPIRNTSAGLPPVTGAIVLNGNGSIVRRSATPGTPPFRVIDVGGHGVLTLNGLTVAGGFSSIGAGIANDGRLTLNLSQVSDNVSTISAVETFGGGILNFGQLTLNASRVSHNMATTPTTEARGGGIENLGGTLTLNASQVVDNVATTHGLMGRVRGGGIHNTGRLTLIASRVDRNSDSAILEAGGGGISNTKGATTTLIASEVADNRATASLGGAAGGGILNEDGTVALTAATVIGNVPDNCFPTGTISGCTG